MFKLFKLPSFFAHKFSVRLFLGFNKQAELWYNSVIYFGIQSSIDENLRILFVETDLNKNL